MANFYTDNRDLRFHLTHPAMEKIVRLKEMDYRDREHYDYAPCDYEDAMDNYERVLDIIGAICADVIAPNAADVDHDGPTVAEGHVTYARGTQENHEALTRAGVIGMNFPRKYDGLNFPMVPYVMAAELVSRADAGFANIWGLQDCGETILEFASQEIKEQFAPAKLVGDRKMGLIKYVMSLMNGARLGVGAQSVGISEAAYREALKYAHERAQFGKPIIQFPAVYEMLAVIKAKLQASRTLLYETTRFVDIYKAYGFIAEDRKLTPEERAESKQYQKLADMFTPLLKLMSSEYSNQNAYDSLQIHGGSGFMKDYPIERIYRDARITTIYEGTSQLQVVAAQRYVTNGSYLAQMREYEKAEVKPEYELLKKELVSMTDQFEKAIELIAGKDNEYIDFHARRLVEMAGHIIMSYLLLIDSQCDDSFAASAEIYIGKSKAWNNERYSYLCDFTEYKMTSFLAIKGETVVEA